MPIIKQNLLKMTIPDKPLCVSIVVSKFPILLW